MSNKLPWFTHDHNAHQDIWIRHLVRKQGHVAGWLWWVLLELHHDHGVGDVLKIDISDVARAGLTSNSVVTRVLTEMQTEFQGQSKLRFNLVGTELELEIKKFRERQAKLKVKTPSRLPQDSFKTPIEREGEGERERDKEEHIAVSPPPKKLSTKLSTSKELTAIQKVIRGFKEAKGVDAENKDWDKKFFARQTRPAKELLVAFNEDPMAAISYILTKSVEWEHLSDWGLEAVVKAAGREYNRIGGENGLRDKPVVADSISGPRSTGRYSQSRDMAFDALRGIESTAIQPKESGNMGSSDEDFSDD